MYLLHYKYHIEQLGNRYTLTRLLGSGRIADVYLAWDEWEQHEAVVKVIRPDVLDPAMQERFLREGKSAASLEHPHITRVYSCVLEEIHPDPASTYKIPYMVMEHVTGGDLKKLLLSGRPFPLDERVHIFGQLCLAVQNAHDRGVIHRDIKPSNILFYKHPLKGDQLVLSDFGLAFLVDSTHYSLSEGGTAAYMAPEQQQGDPQKASDIFSLGVVLYQLCTGQLPSPLQTPKKPTLLNPALPPALDDVILRALSHNPSQRFASASLFWQAIQNAVKQTPLSQSSQAHSSVVQSLTFPPLAASFFDGERQQYSIPTTLDQLGLQAYVNKVLKSLALQIRRFRASRLVLFRRVKKNSLKDFFISYASTASDSSWASWIQGQLHEDGHSTLLPSTVLPSDSDFEKLLQEASMGAERTIVVLSPGYVNLFKNPKKFIRILRRKSTKNVRTILPVYVGESDHEVKRRLASIKYTDLSAKDETIARAFLLATVRGEGVQLPGTPPFPGRPSSTPFPAPQHEISSTSSISPFKIFISHSHSEQDTKLLSVFERHLSSLTRTGTISHWDDSQIGAGYESVQEINNHLNQAHIILLLVSPDYMALNPYNAEMEQALRRHNRGEARVIPVVLRPIYLKGTSLGELKVLPTGDVAITEWSIADAAFVNVIEGIQKAIEEFRDTSLG